MTFARVQDSTFVRDMTSTAILQTDVTVVRKHEKRIKELQKEQVRDAAINSLRSDIDELKNLMKQLISNKSIV